MPEKFTVQAFNYIGSRVAIKAVDDLGIKFSAHQHKLMIARFTANFTSGAATALRMLADGHDLSDVQSLADDVENQIKNEKQ